MMIFMSHALKRTLRQKIMVLSMIVFPLGIALAPQPRDDYLPIGFTLYGLIILFSAFLMTKQTLEDRMQKTVIRIAAAPIDHMQYLVGHLLAYLIILIAQNIIFITMTLIVWNTLSINYFYVFIVYVSFSILSISFSLCWHLMFKSYATSVAVFSVVVNVLAVLGGLTMPMYLFPQLLRDIAVVLPTYWFTYGLESFFDQAYGSALLSLFIIITFAIIFLVIGSKRRLE